MQTCNYFPGHVFEREKTELKERYEEQIANLHGELELLRGKLEEEREALAQRYEVEKEALEEQLAQQIREELEVPYYGSCFYGNICIRINKKKVPLAIFKCSCFIGCSYLKHTS